MRNLVYSISIASLLLMCIMVCCHDDNYEDSVDMEIDASESAENLECTIMDVDIDDVMYVGTEYCVKVVIDKNYPHTIRSELGDTVLPDDSEFIYVSTVMRAQLNGKFFDIVELSSEEQIFLDHNMEWTWSVIPLRSGVRSLHLSVSAILQAATGDEYESSLPVYSKDIQVKIDEFSVIEFLYENWQYILGIIAPIFTAVLVLIIRYLLNNKQK